MQRKKMDPKKKSRFNGTRALPELPSVPLRARPIGKVVPAVSFRDRADEYLCDCLKQEDGEDRNDECPECVP